MVKISPTKDKIIQKAIDLYNAHGLHNVLNQDIAKAANMSLSNFNYHFPKKRDLIYYLCGHLNYVLDHRIKENKQLTNEGIILELTKTYLLFENDFKFFYLETQHILRSHPDLKGDMEQRIKEDIQMIKNLNYIAIGKGYMHHEPDDFNGLYDIIANQIWMMSHFWYAQSNLRKEEGDLIAKGLRSCYAVLDPYLTNKGKEIYRNYLRENGVTI